ncbi:Aminopeptidase N [Pseudolycoriella hygida]|uniref:Aminopeptidase N n=1 Tax=Pseudolycoriella hygida TaxID=35572 RepID=A0A9Q0S424_9DIPT|nr:Aminopeptidase N [Pseudolycoriella hygida]
MKSCDRKIRVTKSCDRNSRLIKSCVTKYCDSRIRVTKSCDRKIRAMKFCDRKIRVMKFCDRKIRVNKSCDRKICVTKSCDRKVRVTKSCDRKIRVMKFCDRKNRATKSCDRKIRVMKFCDRKIPIIKFCDRKIRVTKSCDRKIRVNKSCDHKNDFFKPFLVVLSVSLTVATTNYDAISRGKKPELLQGNFETFRLPNDTRALAYDVSIRTWIDEGNLTFTGSVRIGIIVEQSTNTITLHHRELIIEEVSLLSATGDAIEIGTASYDEIFEFFTIPVTNGNLTVGDEYTVVISYRGTMPTTCLGADFTRFGMLTATGMMSTMGRHSSRLQTRDVLSRATMKSEESLDLLFASPTVHPIQRYPICRQYQKIQLRTQTDRLQRQEFQQTPLMSTYIVAFHVSDFAHAFSSVASVPHRIFTRPSVVNQTSRALRDGERMLDALSEHFGLDFVLPKMDSVSLPEFGGAMENFGLITYSDYYMLSDENDDWEKRRVSLEIVAHEHTHQWFGNLVTPTWWTYTWMKEGFATLFHMFGMDLVYPEWTMRDYMLVATVHNMFRFESDYGNNRPMTHYVEQPEEIDSVFDNVSYSKAATVLRMFLFAFGEETFMEALRSYLQIHQFSDVTEEHLFDALEIAVRNNSVALPPTTNVTAIMSSWTRQAGFPFVTVERNYNQGTDQVTLTQSRYFYPTVPIDPDNTTYWVPYNYATPDNPGFNSSVATGWIPQHQNIVTITVDSLDASDYFLLDTYAGGYYRILYDERNYRLISDAMIENPEHFQVTSKASLLENVREFFNNQELSIVPVMDVIRILENEVNYVAWRPVQYFILEIDALFSGHQNYPLFRDFVRELVEALYDSVRVESVPDEPILRKPGRQLAVSLACEMGSVHCRSDALRHLRTFMASGNEFHPNIRRQIYCAALRSADSNEFNFVWNRMLESSSTSQRTELIQSLGCSTSRILINRLLASVLPSTNENDVDYRVGEAYDVFRSVYRNSINNLELTLDFVIENALETYETFGANGPNFLIEMAQWIRRNDLTEKFRQLLQIYVNNGLISQATIYIIEEIMYERRDIFEQHGEAINQWLLTNFA